MSPRAIEDDNYRKMPHRAAITCQSCAHPYIGDARRATRRHRRRAIAERQNARHRCLPLRRQAKILKRASHFAIYIT